MDLTTSGATRTTASPIFVWRTKDGRHIPVKQMPTDHLFNTVKMIWNNHVPSAFRVGFVRFYNFGPSYPKSYLREAIIAMAHELPWRKDLKAEQKALIDQMLNHLQQNNHLLTP